MKLLKLPWRQLQFASKMRKMPLASPLNGGSATCSVVDREVAQKSKFRSSTTSTMFFTSKMLPSKNTREPRGSCSTAARKTSPTVSGRMTKARFSFFATREFSVFKRYRFTVPKVGMYARHAGDGKVDSV